MKKLLIISVIFLTACWSAFGESFVLVPTRARIVIAKGEPEFVALAAEDLASDIRAISGAEMKIVRGGKAVKGDILLRTDADDSRWEAYDVEVSGGVLKISGSDARGTMFGVYDFIENYLGVDPLSFWNDTPVPVKDNLAWKDVSIHRDTPSVRYRGWFIDNEDLLSDWKEPSGKRMIGYPYYYPVVNHSVMEKIAETLVRCRFNFIIPADLLNVSNPAEAALVDICARRGVFVSIHTTKFGEMEKAWREMYIAKKDRFITALLSPKEADQYHQGRLTFPEDVLVAFPDNWSAENWTAELSSGRKQSTDKYGIYYHFAHTPDGAHLASVVPASRTYEMMQEAVKKNSADYAIFNVSNIREFTYNIAAASKMLWEIDSFSPESWTQEWIGRHFSKDEAKWRQAFDLLYNSVQAHPASGVLFTDGYMNKNICRKELSRLESEVKNNGSSKGLSANTARTYSSLHTQKASFELAMNFSQSLYNKLPDAEKQFAYTTIVHPATLMYHLTSFAANILLARTKLAWEDLEACKKSVEDALAHMAEIRKTEAKYCSGKWENWYAGCRKINLNDLEEGGRSVLRAIKEIQKPQDINVIESLPVTLRYLGDEKEYLVPKKYIHSVIKDKTIGSDAFIETYYEPLRANNPEYISRESIGVDDSGKYTMWCYTFTPQNYKKTVYIQAGVHGRNEFETYFSTAEMMHLITEADSLDDPHLRYLRDSVRFVIVPLVNVSDVNERTAPPKNSSKINLNRDWYDGKSREIRNIKALLSRFEKGEICFSFDIHTDPRGIPGWGAYLLPYADDMPKTYTEGLHAVADFLYEMNIVGKVQYEGEDLYRAFIGPNSEYPSSYKEWMYRRRGNYRRGDTWKSCSSGLWKTFGIPCATLEHGARKYGPEGSSFEMARAIEMILNHVLMQTR